MTQERDLPPRNTGQAKAASPLEHRIPKEVLPVNSSKDDDTPHFQFISF